MPAYNQPQEESLSVLRIISAGSGQGHLDRASTVSTWTYSDPIPFKSPLHGKKSFNSEISWAALPPSGPLSPTPILNKQAISVNPASLFCLEPAGPRVLSSNGTSFGQLKTDCFTPTG
ncbi:hypothetical protein ElyMa_000248000 [Elysia marginata]|uniref:Uncharacterized protein n=1 Tax=Elysia marginata TaxID=1093978 RepID=A0AAV4F1Y9_9GAST|nr:hypothetical protein ElyMa_000248000 [Elysia marginata]